MKFTQIVEQFKGKTTSALILVMGCKDGFIKMVSFGKLPKI